MKNTRILWVVIAAFALSSCTCPPRGKIQHTLMAWLNNSKDAGDRAKFIATIESLKSQIKEIKSVEVGSAIANGRGGFPPPTNPPSILPATTDTFDVGFVMTFANEADFESYENNPIHQTAKKDILIPLSRVIEINTFLAK